MSTRLNNVIVGSLSGALIGSVPGWLIAKGRGAAIGAAVGAAGLGLVGFLSGSNGSSGTGTAGLPAGLGRLLDHQRPLDHQGWVTTTTGKRVYVSGDHVFVDGRWMTLDRKDGLGRTFESRVQVDCAEPYTRAALVGQDPLYSTVGNKAWVDLAARAVANSGGDQAAGLHALQASIGAGAPVYLYVWETEAGFIASVMTYSGGSVGIKPAFVGVTFGCGSSLHPKAALLRGASQQNLSPRGQTLE